MRRAACCAFLAVVAVAGTLNASSLDPAPCPVEIPEGTGADCYWLRVPENRARPDSRAIEVPVVVLRSPNPDKKSDPVLYTVGGPGGRTLKNMKGRARIPLLRDRDVILFEQRGVGLSRPSLQCPEYNRTQLLLSEENIAGAAAVERQLAAARACRERLQSQGIDLAGYNTSEAAADIDDLRRLMKIEKLNLYSVSYGAQLMLTVMREHPEGIRSAFLDSVLPPNVHYDEMGLTNVLRSLSAVFSDCEADPACSRAHPRVRENFDRLVAQLNAKPMKAQLKSADGTRLLSYALNGRNVLEAVIVLLNDASSIAGLPQMIDAAAEKQDFNDLLAALQQNIGEGGYAWGARLSVWCHDAAPFNSDAAVTREQRRYPEFGGLDSATVPREVCASWSSGRAPASYAEPVVSSIPTLIYAGSYDPNTPPQWGMLAAQTLERATYVQFAGQSHGAGETRCGWRILTDFIADPERPLDLTCAGRFRYPQFE